MSVSAPILTSSCLHSKRGRCLLYLSDIHSVVGMCPICFVTDECEWARGALVHRIQVIRDPHSDSKAADLQRRRTAVVAAHDIRLDSTVARARANSFAQVSD